MQNKAWYSPVLASIALVCACSLMRAQNTAIVACQFDSTGLCKYGAYSPEGEVVLPFAYKFVWKHNWGIWVVEIENGTLILDANGHPFIADTVERTMQVPAGENRLPVLLRGKWGFYNTAGQLVIKHQFDETSEFYNGYAKCVLKGKTIAIDTNGTKVSIRKVRDAEHYFIGDVLEMSSIPSFQDDSLSVRLENGLYGVVDRNNVWKIPPVYQSIGQNLNGRILALKNGRWGVIDYDGNVIIPFEHARLYFQ